METSRNSSRGERRFHRAGSAERVNSSFINCIYYYADESVRNARDSVNAESRYHSVLARGCETNVFRALAALRSLFFETEVTPIDENFERNAARSGAQDVWRNTLRLRGLFFGICSRATVPRRTPPPGLIDSASSELALCVHALIRAL